MPNRSTFGYPGVTGRSLPDDGKMSKTRIDGRPYLCVAYDVERRTVQPLRLGAGLVVAPLIIYSASQLPPEKKALRRATIAAGVAVGYWSLWVWWKAYQAMQTEPTA
jgi:hypothetical protein